MKMRILFKLAILLIITSFNGAETMEKKNIEESLQAPKYLYKILSSYQWESSIDANIVVLPAEDLNFVHLAKEDQLNGIIEKYWSEARQLVILKVESSKLKGKMVYEANPQGKTKYYHLYDGSIPFCSIVEAKIIYQKPALSCDHQNLQIELAGSPVLRQEARELSEEEIASEEIQKLILEMKETMKGRGVGLAAPQIGRSIQLAVIEDMDHSHLTEKDLLERDRSKVPFHVIINPKIYVEEAEKAEFFEGCLSVPNLLYIVPRAKAVRVECLNEKGEKVIIKAKGWYARILQHEIDHLHGIMDIDRSYISTLTTEGNYFKLWRGKNIKEVKDTLIKNSK